MTPPADAALTEYSGTVPVLSFASLPLFPYASLPFQFTQRSCRAAIERSQEQEGLVLLLPAEGHDAPPAGIGCLAKVTLCCPGTENSLRVTLRGLVRAQVVQSRADGLALVRAVPDRYPSPAAIDRILRRQELVAEARSCCRDHMPVPLEALATQEISLGCLCDIVAQGLSLSAEARQELVAITNVDFRSDLLLDHLRAERRRKLEYPPHFSSN